MSTTDNEYGIWNRVHSDDASIIVDNCFDENNVAIVENIPLGRRQFPMICLLITLYIEYNVYRNSPRGKKKRGHFLNVSMWMVNRTTEWIYNDRKCRVL